MEVFGSQHDRLRLGPAVAGTSARPGTQGDALGEGSATMMIFSSHRSGRTTGAQRAALVGLAALLPVFAVVGAASPRGAGAGDTTPKVTICHATNSDTNQYRTITVDANAVIKRGHDGHEGPVWNPTLKDAKVKWGDIIPAFDWVDKQDVTHHYAGMNTDALDVIANGCKILTVKPVEPTVTPSTICDVQGTYTIPATKGVVYLLDGTTIAAGTYNGPKTATITAQAKPGYLLSDPTWSYALNLPAAAVCPTQVTPVNPTYTLSSKCDVEGTYTIPATTGITYLLAGTPIAANTYQGPVSGTVTAQADTGYTLSTTNWSYALSVPAAVACPATVVVVVTPVNPTVAPSAKCNVQGTYTIPATTGITYLLGTTVKAAGTYDGPASGLVTATANEGYTLSTSSWSYQLTVAAPEICPAAVVDTPTAVVDAPTATTTGTTPTAETTAALPKTGFPTAALAGAAALALLLGVGLLAVGTRRPQADLS
jgi:hypothetical protein